MLQSLSQGNARTAICALCCAWLICALLARPAQSQQSQSAAEASIAPSDIEALPEPTPQPRIAPLRGQVEHFTDIVPNAATPNSSQPPGQPDSDPFAGLVRQNASPDDRQNAQPKPRVPDLRGLLQTLMSMQGVQEQPRPSAPPAVRPDWIPGYAYTNEFMVAPYHNLNGLWFDRQLLPRRPKWIKLSESVSKFWKGFVPDPCLVLITPLPEAPNNFSFKSPVHRAPNGWLQYTGEADRSGFPLYRYWFGRP